MKKILLLSALLFGLSEVSFSQSAGGSGAEKVSGGMGRARRSSKSGQIKPRKQMRHFESRKADPNMKHNGTSYRMQRRKEQIEAEGNGFGAARQPK
jgi:hypothetical protein